LLRFVDIPVGSTDRPGCRRCRDGSTQRLFEPAQVLSAVSAAVDSWPGGSGPNLAFGGADPLAHPQLAEFVAAAASAGAQRIRLDTSAAQLADPDLARALLRVGARHLQIALLGATPQTHADLLGGSEGLDATLAGAACFAKVAEELGLHVHVSARVLVCRHNLHELPGIVPVAVRAGASLVRLVLADASLALDAAAPWIEAACDTGMVNATWVLAEGVPLCAARGWELHLASVYEPAAGAKGAACAACPLDGVCGGAMAGASASVTAALRPPADAASLAQRVARGFSAPRSVDA
jgi:MoaA/NifB/PqqE/SkfB family radical SAM enzyme